MLLPCGYFNPRSPCGERPNTPDGFTLTFGFQSTLPMRGATLLQYVAFKPRGNFNPRSPCGERLPAMTISWAFCYFNPRSPCGERLSHPRSVLWIQCISIHAPHAGSDRFWRGSNTGRADFNPRFPCGERPWRQRRAGLRSGFQSTLPMRGATGHSSYDGAIGTISIHASHAGSDSRVARTQRLPCGISIHASHAGSDQSVRLPCSD